MKKENIEHLKYQNIFGMIGLSVISLGLYVPFWNRKTGRLIGELLPSNSISHWYFPVGLTLLILSYGTAILDPDNSFLVGKLLAVPEFIFSLVWTFKIRNRVNQIFEADSRSKSWLWFLWTWVFGCFYIQHRINKAKVSELSVAESSFRRGAVSKSLEWVAMVFVISFHLSDFLGKSFYMASDSMLPTILSDERIIASELAFGLVNPFSEEPSYLVRWATPKQGQIVVFKAPSYVPEHAGKMWIMRMVAGPGQRVQRPELEEDKLIGLACDKDSCLVQQGYAFMMGDNRGDAFDSRYWGALPINNIMYKPLFIWWSSVYGRMFQGVE